MAIRLYRRHDVLARTGLAASTLYVLIRRGEFPPSIPLTSATRNGRPAAVAWDGDAVDQWIADRIAAASGEAA